MPDDDPATFRLADETYRRLMSYPGVHTISVGAKRVGGRYTGTMSIQVLVTRKLPPHELRPDEMIPPEIQGVPTDVVEEGPATLLAGCVDINDSSKCRPLVGGSQVQARHGLDVGGTGTLGCLARTKDLATNLLVLLSNAHVIGDKDSHVGDKVGQPAMCSVCSGCCSDTVGKVLRFKKTAHVDAAIATINDDIPHTARQIKEIGTVMGTRRLSQHEAQTTLIDVQKRGASSGRTLGTVVGWVQQPLDIHNHNGSLYRTATDQLRISVRDPSKCFAIGGDSGSVVLDENRNVVALLHAATSTTGDTGFATPIQFVEDELQIEILTATTEVHVDCSGGPSTTLAELAHPQAAELLDSAAGRMAADLFDRHLAEVRSLVREQLRVTAVWRRNGGPELIQLIAESARRPERPIPAEWNGLPLGDRVRRILDVLTRYGSAALRADIERYGSFLAGCGGLTLPQIARRLPEEM
jgi:hypothetical protein